MSRCSEHLPAEGNWKSLRTFPPIRMWVVRCMCRIVKPGPPRVPYPQQDFRPLVTISAFRVPVFRDDHRPLRGDGSRCCRLQESGGIVLSDLTFVPLMVPDAARGSFKHTRIDTRLRSAQAVANCTGPSRIGEQGKLVSSPEEPGAQPALWEKFLDGFARLWDSRSKKLCKLTGDQLQEPSWIDSQHAWQEGRLPTSPAVSRFRPSYQSEEVPDADRSNLLRAVADETPSGVGAWFDVYGEGGLTEAVGALDSVVQQGSYVPTALVYGVLKRGVAEKDLVVGKLVHSLTRATGYESSTFLANHIIRMYTSHGRLLEATKVFSNLDSPDVFAWCFIILAHVEQGQPTRAIELYKHMRQLSVKPDSHTYVAVLKACASALDLASGKQVHSDILSGELQPSVFVGNCLVDMYVKCGSLEDARRVFDNLLSKNVVTWTAIIGGYAQQGLGEEALSLYASMHEEGINTADRATYVCLLKACASIGGLHQGKSFHEIIKEKGLESDVVVGSSLVDMYAKCGSLEDACSVFEKLPTKNMVTWTAIIYGYVQHGRGQEALDLYASIQREGMLLADRVTFAGLVKACASIGALSTGKELHLQIQKSRLDHDGLVGNSLVDMYVKCGSLEDAGRVFNNLQSKDVATWTAMIAGYGQHGLCHEALSLYARMQKDGIVPANHVTYVCLLNACARVRALSQGKQLHSQIQDRGLEVDVVIGSSLVDMYAKCGSLLDARRVFDRLPTRNVVTWNSMLAGYAQQGFGEEALALYSIMQEEGTTPAGHGTYVCVLNACASIGALRQGKQLHSEIQENGLEVDLVIGNCLVDMYAKCGSLFDARKVFDGLPKKDVVTWTALLNGYAQNNDSQKAMQCFQEMQQHGVEPNDATFLCLLTSFRNQAMVSEGRQYFKVMMEQYAIAPTVFHYAVMVDLLGRSGFLNEAEDMLKRMPVKEDTVGWMTLLCACRKAGDTQRGERCFNRLTKLEPQNAATYALMSNIYENASRWSDVQRIESRRISAGACKKPARAWIEVGIKVHTFTVGETRDDISSRLKSANLGLEEDKEHELPDQLVLQPLSQREKGDVLCGHAEKLALAFGLLNTSDGTPLLVTKNLRMCQDCHNSTKVLSRIEKREIIVRDAHCVHRFVDGLCSCGDSH